MTNHITTLARMHGVKIQDYSANYLFVYRFHNTCPFRNQRVQIHQIMSSVLLTAVFTNPPMITKAESPLPKKIHVPHFILLPQLKLLHITPVHKLPSVQNTYSTVQKVIN